MYLHLLTCYINETRIDLLQELTNSHCGAADCLCRNRTVNKSWKEGKNASLHVRRARGAWPGRQLFALPTFDYYRWGIPKRVSANLEQQLGITRLADCKTC
jgi:hypothetical protein